MRMDILTGSLAEFNYTLYPLSISRLLSYFSPEKVKKDYKYYFKG